MKRLIRSQYQRAKQFYLRYERWLMPATLLVGFLVDYFTFANIQTSITFTLLMIYWALAGMTIAFINLYEGRQLPPKLQYARLFAPLLIQFAFGALLGASLVFYWFSGAFSVSWPLMALIIILMVSNDVFRHHFAKPLVQISVYFFASISIFSIILPFVFNSLSIWMFVGAGALALAIFVPYIYFVFAKTPQPQPQQGGSGQTRAQRRALIACVLAIYALMNALYFADITPPIPLVLREAGLYHSIAPTRERYVMQGERENFFASLLQGQTLHVAPTGRVYAYTAIFAPANLRTTIVHHWQYYDPELADWVSKSKLPFAIAGGRREGYKGYSWISELEEGRWRVYVENTRGQVLGRLRFNIIHTQTAPELQEVVR